MLLAVLVFLLSTDPALATSLLQQGLVALKEGHTVEARKRLEEASQNDPKNAYVWVSLAETYRRLQEGRLASDAAEHASKLAPDDAVVSHGLAIYYGEVEQWRRAGELERRFAESPGADKDASSRAANLLLRGEDFDAAADVAGTALKSHPDDPQLLLTLGVARYGQRRFEDAMDAFLRVIQIDATVEQPYVFLGKMLDQAGGRLPQIQAADERWAKGNPQSAVAALELAKALLASDPKSARALNLLQESISLDGSNWEAHYQLGTLLEQRHEYPQAAEELRRTVELNGREAMPHYHLARVYDRLGDHERAQAEREIHSSLTRPSSR